MLYSELFHSSDIKLGNIISSAQTQLSALLSLNSCSPDHPIIIKIVIQVSRLRKSGKFVVFCCVPGHDGLSGSQFGDEAAKAESLHRNFFSDRVLGSDVCIFIHRAILFLRQEIWANTLGNKLPLVKSPMRVCLTIHFTPFYL